VGMRLKSLGVELGGSNVSFLGLEALGAAGQYSLKRSAFTCMCWYVGLFRLVVGLLWR
jgi:hypothetical protein